MAGNSGKTVKSRGKPFKPGQSGNPSGRPKIPDEFKELAKKHSIAALKKTIDIMTNPEASHKDQLTASNMVMDRAWGKAMQGMELSGPDGKPIETTNLSPEERQARINELIAKRGS